MSAKKAPAKSKRGLGRGMSALLPSATPAARSDKSLISVGVEEISPMPGQPRRHFDPQAIEDLARSIKRHGILQPLLVRRAGKGYELVAGERRWRAAQQAGLSHVPVIVKEVGEEEAFQWALVENIHRKDLNAMEIARAFQRLVKDHKLSQQEIAEQVEKDRASVANYLRLLKLPKDIQGFVEDGKIPFGHARALASLDGEEIRRIDLKALLDQKLSVRQVERRVQDIKKRRDETGKKAPKSDAQSAQVRHLCETVERTVGLKVSLKDKKGRGTLTFHYSNLDELDNILERLGIKQ